jgi:uncharacterized membrane protein YccF (DUF307 family)
MVSEDEAGEERRVIMATDGASKLLKWVFFLGFWVALGMIASEIAQNRPIWVLWEAFLALLCFHAYIKLREMTK